MNLRIQIVRKAIRTLEKALFYPRLRKRLMNYYGNVSATPILILDVGANRGQSIDFFKKLFRNSIIHSFEPLPQLFQGLTKYKSDPQIFLNNLCIVSPLLLKINGTKTVFYESILDETSTLILPDATSGYQVLKARLLGQTVDGLYKKIEVDATTVDLYCFENQINKIDILKIDVEGYELGVLEGCTVLFDANRIECVVLESHEDDMRESSKNDIDNLLMSAGLQIVSRIRHPFGKFFEEVWIKTSV